MLVLWDKNEHVHPVEISQQQNVIEMLLKCFFTYSFSSHRAVQRYKGDDSQTVALAISDKNDFTASNFWTDFKFFRKTVRAKFLIREMFKFETIFLAVDSKQMNVNFRSCVLIKEC